MTKRPTAQEYKGQYEDIVSDLNVLESKITQRLIDLCKLNPEVPVARKADLDKTIIKAKSLNAYYITNLSIQERLQYIYIIEQYLQEQHPHKQTEIKF